MALALHIDSGLAVLLWAVSKVVVVIVVVVVVVAVVVVVIIMEDTDVTGTVDSVVSFDWIFDWLQKVLYLRWPLVCDEFACSLVFIL